jgi:hypothetical protein
LVGSLRQLFALSALFAARPHRHHPIISDCLS